MIFFPSLSAGLVHTISSRNFLFDFGTPPPSGELTLGADINGNYWNNFSGNSRIDNIKTTRNENTNIDIFSSPGFNFQTGFNPGGLTNPSGVLLGDLAISSATRDYYFAVPPTRMGFRLQQLDQSKVYDFGFFGSREIAITRTTAYIVSGGNITMSGNLTTSGPGIGSGGYNGNNNTILELSGIIPDNNNEILFYLETVTGGFQYLNAMKIKENIDPKPRVLAIGSSIINRWNTISRDLGTPILNSSIEASTMAQWLPNASENYWNNRIVPKQNSPAVLVYLGSNDISNGVSADTLYNNSSLFLNELLNLSPDLKIIYLSVIRSPAKLAEGKISVVNNFNNQIQSWITGQQTRMYYADINTFLVDAGGNPLTTGLFQADNNHLTSSGYVQVTQALNPLFQSVLNTGLFDQSGYRLVWMDDFNGTGINTNYWSAHDNYPDVNGELQFYTSRTGVSGNINVSGSTLYITARSGEYTGQGPWMSSPKTGQFTSALVETLNKKEFQYGKIEGRMKIPSGHGLWPAFWMLGDNYFTAGFPLCGEIDIMEHANVQPNYTAALHTFNRNHTIPAGGWVGATNINNYHTEFNTYGVEWTTGQISFYLNNNTFFTVTKAEAGNTEQDWPFDQPFWIKLNLAVGGSYGGTPSGYAFPSTMEIDWVKVYQK